ncbi:hypothetical protein GR239_36730, partial [Rhizobium leguminosarum]|uniref:hypothetical protein n=1 Tax=Rhizobium ruizarguesonis TaxID=2081791 RepID=UPI0013B73AD1
MAGPGGVEVGRASVRVLPNTTNFAPALKRYLERIENTNRLNIAATVDVDQLVTSARAAVATAEAAIGELDVDTDIDAAELATSANRAVEAAESAAPEVDIDADID